MLVGERFKHLFANKKEVMTFVQLGLDAHLGYLLYHWLCVQVWGFGGLKTFVSLAYWKNHILSVIGYIIQANIILLSVPIGISFHMLSVLPNASDCVHPPGQVDIEL